MHIQIIPKNYGSYFCRKNRKAPFPVFYNTFFELHSRAKAFSKTRAHFFVVGKTEEHRGMYVIRKDLALGNSEFVHLHALMYE